jgi:hypothetical protein
MLELTMFFKLLIIRSFPVTGAAAMCGLTGSQAATPLGLRSPAPGRRPILTGGPELSTQMTCLGSEAKPCGPGWLPLQARAVPNLSFAWLR